MKYNLRLVLFVLIGIALSACQTMRSHSNHEKSNSQYYPSDSQFNQFSTERNFNPVVKSGLQYLMLARF